jgi:CcmD family protein
VDRVGKTSGRLAVRWAGLAAALAVACLAAAPAAWADVPAREGVVALAMQQPAPGDEFVPVTDLPPEEQLPAAPLLVGAYAFAWVMVAGYLWSIWRRLSAVEREIAQVARQLDAGRRT